MLLFARRMLLPFLILLLSATVCMNRRVALAGQVPTAAQYTVTDLGTLGGTSSYAYGINNAGQVTGYSTLANGNSHAFVYNGKQMQDLETLPGTSSSIAFAINAGGQVVGQSGYHGFYYDGTLQDLGMFGASLSVNLMGINASKTIVGTWLDLVKPSSVFTYSNGKTQFLPVPGGASGAGGAQAGGINDAGDVVGGVWDTENHGRAYLWKANGDAQSLKLWPESVQSFATAINASSQIVGYATVKYPDASRFHAFLYSNGSAQDLGALGGQESYGYAVNAQGDVVGMAIPANSGARAFLYSGGTMQNLNDLIPADSHWILGAAYGINDKGQIVGIGRNPDGQGHAFLLTPLVHVDRVVMASSHVLQVQVSAIIDPGMANKYLFASFTLNGTPVLQAWEVPGSMTGFITHIFNIDLVTARVPRFQDNQVFAVTGDRYEDGIDTSETLEGNEIPLPLVHVHGILTDATSDRIPHGLFNALKASHPSYQENACFPDLGADNGYPTLISFDYHSMQDKVEKAGQDLASWISSQVKSHTYADGVNIVAHSKGGIIARAAIAYSAAGQNVNKLILVGSPCEGTPWASAAYAYFGSIKAIIEGVQFRYGLLLSSNLTSILNALVSATPQSVLELCPTYGWWASSRANAVVEQFQMPPRPANDTLNRLNAQGLDTRVSYYAIASGTWPGATLNHLWGKYTNPVLLYGELTDDVAYDAGDGLVPLRSQLAQDLDWPRGQGPGKFHPYETVYDVFHTGYFDSVEVQKGIEAICWN